MESLDIGSSLVTPEQIRGLSLEEVTNQYRTPGLYVRTLDTLDQVGLGDNELIASSINLGFLLHANDLRTNGHYVDHLMRVTLHMIEDFEVRDPNLIAAGPLHDSFEDHPRDLAQELTGRKPANPVAARRLGREALAELINPEVVEIIEAVTNPPVMLGEDKLAVYARHVAHLIQSSPKARVLKLADFFDNAVGNHMTIGPKRERLDKKYIALYSLHKDGLLASDSLIQGEARDRALETLEDGYQRALGRLGITSAA